MVYLSDVQADIRGQLDKSFPGLTTREKQEMCRYGLAEETGEVMGIFKGRARNYPKDVQRCADHDLKNELGDVLWYLAALCELHGTSLEEVYQCNCDKLTRRGWREHDN